MNTVYDLTVALSSVVQGMFTMASTRPECVRSNRDTTCDRARSHNRICAVSVGVACCCGEEKELKLTTSSSNVSDTP